MSIIFEQLKGRSQRERYEILPGVTIELVEPSFKDRAAALALAKDGDVALYFKAIAQLVASCAFDLAGAPIFASGAEVMDLPASILDPLSERVQALAGLKKGEAPADPEADRQVGEPSEAEKKEQISSATT